MTCVYTRNILESAVQNYRVLIALRVLYHSETLQRCPTDLQSHRERLLTLGRSQNVNLGEGGGCIFIHSWYIHSANRNSRDRQPQIIPLTGYLLITFDIAIDESLQTMSHNTKTLT